jgi:hypothetical protein
MLSLVITITVPSFAISSFELEVPWQDTPRLLDDPLEKDGVSEVYRFGGKDRLEFHRADVLNRYADVQRILPRGSSVRGWLLGIGSQAIPDRFEHGTEIPSFVTVTDQYMNKYRSSVSFWADRNEGLRRAASKSKRKGLFECPDPGFGHSLVEEQEAADKK